MNLQINDQFLRMSDLANIPPKSEKTVIDREGRNSLVKAQSAKRGIIGFSAKHIYHLIDCGKFPKPIKIGRASLWRLSEINLWLDEQGKGESYVK